LKSASSSISRATLNEKIKTYLNGLVHAYAVPNDETDKLARDLYTILIAPVESYLDRKLQLCFIPDDKLNFVPFAALISPSSSRYLLEDFRIQTASSATTFVASSDQARRMEGVKIERTLIVGNPDFDRTQFADLPNLPGAEREAREIADLYAGTPLQNRAAVASRVKSRLNLADVVHLATHAIPDEQSPLQSKLLFARDDAETLNAHHASAGFISASEIYAMKFPKTRLVVLSACETGIERAYRGEGAIGLARPFIAGGVPIVVASLWPVESEAAANLMISFHKHRKQDHVSTAEALHRAQLEYLHNQPHNSSKDYGWAAFVTIGGYANF
jgi:CHAT domain-containing protein